MIARSTRVFAVPRLSALLNGVFGMRLRDNKSGFFICRRDVLADLLSYRGHYRHWQCFVMVAAHRRGYRIHQVDTPFRPRSRGRSAFGSVPLMATAGVTLDLWQAIRETGRIVERLDREVRLDDRPRR